MQQLVLAVLTVGLGVASAWVTHDVRFVAASFAIGSVASAATGGLSLLRHSRHTATAAVLAA
jgi:hypothetical protein